MYMPQDKCDHKCGIIFEPFWDQCGEMLTMAKMVHQSPTLPSVHVFLTLKAHAQGGMDGMSVFYKHCLEELYPPGSCGRYCNGHTFDCYEKEVHSACCDEGGLNCKSHVPKTCPVGCGARNQPCIPSWHRLPHADMMYVVM